jgi:hypothetical protein
MMIGVMAVGAGLSVLLLGAAAQLYYLHLSAAAGLSTALAVVAIREHRLAAANGATMLELSGIAARYMGLLWGWGAFVLFVTYEFILSWPPSWLLFLATIVPAACCLALAVAARQRERNGALRLIRIAAMVQFVGGCLVLGAFGAIGPLAPDKLSGAPSWAALNIIMGGAAGLALVSGFTLGACHAATRGSVDRAAHA